MLPAISRSLRSTCLASKTLAMRTLSSGTELSPSLKKRIEDIVKKDDVVVFMKGTHDEPMCGFSKNVKLILDYHLVDFKDYNVLEDEDLRNGVKLFSEWPTIPQVYVKSQFVGGSDILLQMHKEGEITDFFDQNGVPSKFSDKLKPKQPSD